MLEWMKLEIMKSGLWPRSWVESVEYWPLYWEQLEAVKKALDKAGIEIPYPRRTVFQGKSDDGAEKGTIALHHFLVPFD